MTERQKSIVTSALELGGLFVTAGKDPGNIMTTHWGGFAKMWNRDVFILPVRKKKYTHELIEKSKCFCINVPREDMTSLIAECDHLSGRLYNKFEKLGLTTKPAKYLPTVSIAECNIILECRVIGSTEIDKARLDPIIAKDMYIDRDSHILYFGEILKTRSLRRT